MDPGSIVDIIVVLLCLTIIALNSAVETSLTNISRLRLHQLLDRGVPRSQALADLVSNPRRLPTIIVMVNLLATLVIGTLVTAQVRYWGGDDWVLLLAALITAIVVLIVSVMVPKSRATANPEKTALRLIGYVNLLQAVAGPLASLIGWLAMPLARLLGGSEMRNSPFVTEEEMRMLVNVAEEDGIVAGEEEQMIHQIFVFGDTLVREVMVPRTDIVAAGDTEPLLAVADRILKYGYSRLPVYHETIDNIVGIVNAKDLLRVMREGRNDAPITELLRKPRFVPETKPVDALLRELQRDRVQLAIIVDEYGGTAGLVTIEDIVEEIVGEIQDEYDSEMPMIEQIGPNEWRVDARTPLDDLDDMLGVRWEEEEVDTIGGLVQDRLGEIPDPGDTVEIDGVHVEVLTTEGLRIKQLLIRRGGTEAGQRQDDDWEYDAENGSSGRQPFSESDLQEFDARPRNERVPVASGPAEAPPTEDAAAEEQK